MKYFNEQRLKLIIRLRLVQTKTRNVISLQILKVQIFQYQFCKRSFLNWELSLQTNILIQTSRDDKNRGV